MQLTQAIGELHLVDDVKTIYFNQTDNLSYKYSRDKPKQALDIYFGNETQVFQYYLNTADNQLYIYIETSNFYVNVDGAMIEVDFENIEHVEEIDEDHGMFRGKPKANITAFIDM